MDGTEQHNKLEPNNTSNQQQKSIAITNATMQHKQKIKDILP